MNIAGGCPDDIISPEWVRSHVPHALPIGEWIFWNVLVSLQVLVYVNDVFCVDAPVFYWEGECQSSCNVPRT